MANSAYSASALQEGELKHMPAMKHGSATSTVNMCRSLRAVMTSWNAEVEVAARMREAAGVKWQTMSAHTSGGRSRRAAAVAAKGGTPSMALAAGRVVVGVQLMLTLSVQDSAGTANFSRQLKEQVCK
jgi:hypothetical protein